MLDDDEVEELSRAFDDLSVAMRRYRARSSADTTWGLTPAQFELLRLLETHSSDDGLRVSAIAQLAGLATPTVTRTLNGLDAAGLIQRQPLGPDGRAIYVTITEPGRQALRAYQDNRREKQRRTYSAFGPSERKELLATLHRLTALADEHTAQIDDP